MRMNKEGQRAILLSLYLQRAGSATANQIKEGLGLNPNAEEYSECLSGMVSRGIVITTAEDGETHYSLAADVTVADILFIIGEHKGPITGFSMEHRALKSYMNSIKQVLKPVLNRKISNINKELIANEVAMRERANEDGTIQ